MSSSIDLENGLLSYANPNYQLTSSDENCNVEIDGSYDDLYEGLDVACRINRRLSIRSRRKYASLDPVSMGVDVDSETTPMLTSSAENNLNQTQGLNSSDSKDTFQGVDNGNSVFDSNDNKEMGKRSSFLDYYISLESASKKEIKSPPFQSISSSDVSPPKSCTSAVAEKIAGSSNYDTLSYSESTDSDCLPSGWERHEDDSGPYYWHITSGTIQRDPPISHLACNRIPPRMSKDLELISSKKELYLNSRKASCENNIPNGVRRGNILGVHSIDEKIKRRSCPDGSCSLTPDKRPIRFAVRSLGWVEIAEADLTPERSSKAVNKCIVDLSIGRNDILDVVGRWGDGKDLFMDLDDYSLRLMDTQDLTVLNTQPIHTIRVWGVGRDNGRERDFAYVARDRVTKKHMCHVFRCDIPARIIANTLRDICKKIMIERSFQRSLNKHNESLLCDGEKSEFNCGNPARPTDLPMEQGLFHQPDSESSYSGQLFPTPMEEPKKILKVHYLGSTNVLKATGVEVLNDAIEQLSASMRKSDYKYVNVAVAPSTITISEPGDEGKQLAECRVRFLSFLGIGKNIKHCGFIVHTAQDDFVAHVFYCEPSSGALCKTIEAACKLRYQKCLDAHRQDSNCNNSEAQKKGLKTALKSVFGTLFLARHRKSAET